MGIWDLYCKICGGPFGAPEGDPDDLEDLEIHPTDPKFQKLFGWLDYGVVIYPDGRYFETKSHVSNEGATTSDGYYVDPESTYKDNYFASPWKGLAVHIKCLNLSGLFGTNNYNRLYFDTTFNGQGNSDDKPTGERLICEYAGQFFEWSLAIGSEDQWLIEDPEANQKNKSRIVNRGKSVVSFPIDKKFYHLDGPIEKTIQTPTGPVSLSIPSKYTVAGVLDFSNEMTEAFGKIFQVSPKKADIIRSLKKYDLLVGPHQNFVDNPQFDVLAEVSIDVLNEEIDESEKYLRADAISVLLS